MMYLIMGKRVKIRYNINFVLRKCTKEEIVLVLSLNWKRKVKLNN